MSDRMASAIAALALMTKQVKELEEKEGYLQARNEYLQNLYENALFGCQSLDRNGCLIDVNGAWLDILGFSRQEVIGQSFSEFLHPGQRDRFHEKFSGFKLTGEVVWDEQCRNLSGVSEGAGSTLKRR